MAVLQGQPREGTPWEEVQADAFVGLDAEAPYFNAKQMSAHRRGTFPSIAHGISYGGGQKVRVAPSSLAGMPDSKCRVQGICGIQIQPMQP